MRAVPMEFALSAALAVGIVLLPLLLCPGREKEGRFKPPSPTYGVDGLASAAEVKELSTHVGTWACHHEDLGHLVYQDS